MINEANLACTALMYVIDRTPAATHKAVVHLMDFNKIHFVLKNQLNQRVGFLKISSFALNNIHVQC
jgi:hypothetical protein